MDCIANCAIYHYKLSTVIYLHFNCSYDDRELELINQLQRRLWRSVQINRKTNPFLWRIFFLNKKFKRNRIKAEEEEVERKIQIKMRWHLLAANGLLEPREVGQLTIVLPLWSWSRSPSPRHRSRLSMPALELCCIAYP